MPAEAVPVQAPDAGAAHTPAQTLVCYNDPAVDALARRHGAGWVRTDHPDQIRAALLASKDGTLVLNAGDPRSLRAAAGFVHRLRLDGGDRIRIVVYVSDRRLDADETRLLTLCGADLVIEAISGDALMAGVVQVRQQQPSRPPEPEFDAIWQRHQSSPAPSPAQAPAQAPATPAPTARKAKRTSLMS